MKDKNRRLFSIFILNEKHLFRVCFMLVLAGSFSISDIEAQNTSYVSLIVPKKSENPRYFQLLLTDFPRETGPVKKIVNQVGQLVGVDVFNVINHPEGKPALAVLKIKEAASAEEVLRNVLCLIPAAEYRLGKKTFSDCASFTLNKK